VDANDSRQWPLERLNELHLEMGQQCNVRCAMCFQTDFSPSTRMPAKIWKERVAPAYSVAKFLTLVGGEPTILPNCRELVQIVLRDYPNLRLNMATNGVLFTGLWEEAFLAQGSCVNFSVNAVTPSVYASVVQYGRLDKVLANVDHLVKRKHETSSSVDVRISSVVTDQTLGELPIMMQWAVDHGLDHVSFMTDCLGSVTLEPNFVQSKIREAYEISDRHPNLRVIALDDFDWMYAQRKGIPPVRPRKLFASEPAPCPIAFNGLFINSDGSVKPCCKSWYVFGNLHENSLEEIWHGRKAQLLRERINRLDFRDCQIACDLNCKPINPRVATVRKAYWVIKRDPKSALQKGLRKLNLTSAQSSKPLKKA
jgi:radical SAM protein with 4Fe4S-binding SPASM domain